MRESDLVVRVVTAIDAPPERVWSTLVDLAEYRHWHPNLEVLDGSDGPGPLAVGRVLRLRTNAGTPAELEFEVTVTDLLESSLLAWEGGDPEVFYGRHRLSLVPEGQRTSLVNEEYFTGAMAQAVLTQNRAAIEAQYAAGDAALKAVTERRFDNGC